MSAPPTLRKPPAPSVGFFDAQFERQVRAAEFALNPFESVALAYAAGRVLDYGCGLGNFAVAAARRGCRVYALDASPAAIEYLRRLAASEGLAVDAREADLRVHEIDGPYDTVVSIGLLCYFDRASATHALGRLREGVRPGGVLFVNLLVDGTTWIEGFAGGPRCLVPAGEWRARLDDWEVLVDDRTDVAVADGTVKRFVTLAARRPG